MKDCNKTVYTRLEQLVVRAKADGRELRAQDVLDYLHVLITHEAPEHVETVPSDD